MLKPDSVLAFVLLDIAIILVMARLVGGLFVRVGQPRVVGEIVAGVLLGPTLLGAKIFTWGNAPSYLECDTSILAAAEGTAPSITTCLFPQQARGVLGILGQIALVLFMFLVGLELDFDRLKGKGKAILMVSIGAVAVPIALAFVIGPLLYDAKWVFTGADGLASQSSFTLFVAAMLAVTAFPVMARILQEKGLTQTPMGSVGVAAAAVVTVLMFLTVAVASGVASEQGPSALGVKFAAAGLFIAVLFGVIRPALAPLGRAYEKAGRLTPGVFAFIIIVLFASAYTAHKIGINVIVGGFLAGAVLPARVALFRDMASRLSDFTAIILLPIFLAFSGLNTDFTALGSSFIVGILIFLAAGVIGKWLGTAVFARAGGMSWAEGNVLGVLMNCRGLLVLVVGLIGFQQGIISAQMQVGGVVMALVTTAMTAPLFDLFSKKLPAPEPEPVATSAGAGVFRAVAALDDLDQAPLVAHTAFLLVADHHPAEVVLHRPFAIPLGSEILSTINDEQLEVERSSRALKMLAALGPSGVTVTPRTFSATDPPAEHLREAAGADLLVVGWDPAVSGQPGWEAVERLADAAACPVVVCTAGGPGTHVRPAGPVTVIGGEAPPLALALAGNLGHDGAGAVERIETAAPATLVEASRHSGAVVLSAGTGPGVDGQWTASFAEVDCPVYLVFPARVPA